MPYLPILALNGKAGCIVFLHDPHVLIIHAIQENTTVIHRNATNEVRGIQI